MIKLSILFLTILLSFSTPAFAQTSANAAKSWNSFWTQFSSAVNSKNKAAVKKLMASENDFSSGGGGETRDEWLAMIEKEKIWGLLQKAVKGGAKSYSYEGKPSRVTRDNQLIFVFIRGRSRFVGPMGD